MPTSSTATAKVPAGWLKIAAFAAIYIIWGSTYLAIVFAIESLPPFLMAGLRFLLAGALLYTFALLKGAQAPSRLHWRSTFIIGGLLLLIGNGAVVWAEQYVASGIAALLVTTEPLWVVALQWMDKEKTKPNKMVLLGMLIGIVGMLVLVNPWETTQSIEIWPSLIIFLAAGAWAMGLPLL